MANDLAKKKSTKWVKGQSGNPRGRPIGSRNRITLLRESLELELREQGQGRMPEVLDKCFELAMQGDTSMIKLLLELHMSKSAPDVTNAAERVTINIKGPKGDAPKDFIDVTPQDVAESLPESKETH